MRLKKLLNTPLDQVDIAKALSLIEEAEREGDNVPPALIDKAVEHTERAIEVYMEEA